MFIFPGRVRLDGTADHPFPGFAGMNATRRTNNNRGPSATPPRSLFVNEMQCGKCSNDGGGRRNPVGNIDVVTNHGQSGVVATRSIASGEVILSAEGMIVSNPSRYSIQIGIQSHIDLPPTVQRDSSIDTIAPAFFWRYLNHSCRPSAAFDGVDLLAIQRIESGDVITFDYNTTEYFMAEPFTCGCGHCDGRMIAGFGRLSASERAALSRHAASHLLRRVFADAEKSSIARCRCGKSECA